MAFTVDSNWLKSGLDKFVANRAGGAGTIQTWLDDNKSNTNRYRELTEGLAKEQGVYGQMDDNALFNLSRALQMAMPLTDLGNFREGGAAPTTGYLGDADTSNLIANYLNNGSLFQNMGAGPDQGQPRPTGGYGADMNKVMTDLQNAYTANSGNQDYQHAFINSPSIKSGLDFLAASMFGGDSARAWQGILDTSQGKINDNYADRLFGNMNSRIGDWNLGASGYGGLYGTHGDIPAAGAPAVTPAPNAGPTPSAGPSSAGLTQEPNRPATGPVPVDQRTPYAPPSYPGIPSGVTLGAARRDGTAQGSDGHFYRRNPDGSWVLVA